MKLKLISYLFVWAMLVEDCTSRIGCYRCMSSNGSNPSCEDPFNAIDITYEKYCKAKKRNREGVFPAAYCIKLYGHDKSKNTFTLVRECSTEDLGNFRGTFRLNGKDVTGIVTTCRGNGCNGATRQTKLSATIFSMTLLILPYLYAQSH